LAQFMDHAIPFQRGIKYQTGLKTPINHPFPRRLRAQLPQKSGRQTNPGLSVQFQRKFTDELSQSFGVFYEVRINHFFPLNTTFPHKTYPQSQKMPVFK